VVIVIEMCVKHPGVRTQITRTEVHKNEIKNSWGLGRHDAGKRCVGAGVAQAGPLICGLDPRSTPVCFVHVSTARPRPSPPPFVGACACGTPLLCYLYATTTIYIPKRTRLKADSKTITGFESKAPFRYYECQSTLVLRNYH
jgi:hypothetical protein